MDTTTQQRIELGAKLKHMREWDNRFRRKLATEEVIDLLKQSFPRDMVMSRGKLVTLEKGMVKPDPWAVEVLCNLYGHPLGEVAPDLAAYLAQWRASNERLVRTSASDMMNSSSYGERAAA
jgi:hypothetical protein